MQAGEEIRGLHFFAFRPIMIGVAFEAAGFGVVGAGGVAGFAVGDAGDKDVGGFGAGESFLVAADAAEAAMGVVIEFGIREPLHCRKRGLNFWQRFRFGFGWKSGLEPLLNFLWCFVGVPEDITYQMALAARFAPQEFFRVRAFLIDPL